MSESIVTREPADIRERQLLVAMRSTDRRTLISPTKLAPDFFELDDTHADKSIPIENRVAGMMRTHEGVIVNSDHLLRTPADAEGITGYAVYLRGVVDFQKAQEHGQFDVRDLRDMRHGLLELVSDVDNTPEQERRIHRIKAELFQQVINLFEGKGIDGPRRRG